MSDPHAGAEILHGGAPLESARGAAILLHGRGATAADVLRLGAVIDVPGLALLAPQAAGATWYPQSFLAERAANQPGLDSAHRLIERLLDELASAGLPAERCALLGFSQGACLACDHVARFPRRTGGLVAFTGGLIGPPDDPLELAGDLAGTPAFLGANDPDPHVPWGRVERTVEVLRSMGAEVELARYPGEPHAVNADEIRRARTLLAAMVAATQDALGPGR